MSDLRVAVVGVGAFGSNHLRVLRDLSGIELAGVADTDKERRWEASQKFACPVFENYTELIGKADAVVVATPTSTHAEIGCALLEVGLDVLIEKPISSDLASAKNLYEITKRTQAILQIGHLERFNPAVEALFRVVRLPLFFEIHRMSLFSPRSLDTDVILDLMIHDLDIVLGLTGKTPTEVRAAGISILSPKVDIANVRLAFEGGCVANLTASRVSTEKIRKIRVFQPNQYISVDYQRQDGAVFNVSPGPEIGFDSLPVTSAEPLRLELEHFVDCCRRRKRPLVGAPEAIAALELALTIQENIEEHARIVAKSVNRHTATA